MGIASIWTLSFWRSRREFALKPLLEKVVGACYERSELDTSLRLMLARDSCRVPTSMDWTICRKSIASRSCQSRLISAESWIYNGHTDFSIVCNKCLREEAGQCVQHNGLDCGMQQLAALRPHNALLWSHARWYTDDIARARLREIRNMLSKTDCGKALSQSGFACCPPSQACRVFST